MERLHSILQERRAERDRVVLQFGNTMLAWSHVEYWMYVWFRIITEMPAERSWRIFYSQNSFSARVDLLNAALSDQHPPTILTIFIRKAIKKAKQYAVFRNMIAHGQPFKASDSEGIDNEFGSAKKFVISEPKNRAISGDINDLMLAECRYKMLTQALRDVANMHSAIGNNVFNERVTSLFGKYLLLIALFPNEANSMEADPIWPTLWLPPQSSPA